MDKLFENSVDAELFDLFLVKDNSGEDKLNLNISKAKTDKNQSALARFEKIYSEKENEDHLLIDFSGKEEKPKFLDKFYLIEISESRGIIMHEKLDFEVLEEAGIRKLCIVPKDLNDRGVVCTLGSKLAVVNNKEFQEITVDSPLNDEYVSSSIVQSIARLSSFRLTQNKLCPIPEKSRLLAVLEI